MRAPPPSLMPTIGQPLRHGEVDDLDDLLAVDLAEAAAEDGDVLGEDRDRPAVDGAVPGDDAVAERALGVHAEVGRPVPGELVELGERARVEQRLDPLARGHLARGVLLLDGALGARVRRLLHAALEVGQLAGGRVDVDVVGDVLPGALEVSASQRRSVRECPTPTSSRWSDLDRPALDAAVPGRRADPRQRALAVARGGRGGRLDQRRTGRPAAADGRRRGRRCSWPSTRPPAAAGSTGSGRRRRGPGSPSPSCCGPTSRPPAAGWLPLLTGVALAESVGEVTGVRASLKWPNDLLAVDGRKLAGILAESSGHGRRRRRRAQRVHDRPPSCPTRVPRSPSSPARRRRPRAGAARLPPRRGAALPALDGGARRPGHLRAGRRLPGLVARRSGTTVSVTLPDGSTLDGVAEAVDWDGRLVVAHARGPGGAGLGRRAARAPGAIDRYFAEVAPQPIAAGSTR